MVLRTARTPATPGSQQWRPRARTMDIHQLIMTIRQRGCLWNHGNKNHFNRDFTHKHWLEVAEEMGSTYEVVKKKWKGLKDVFRKELKKMAASKSGAVSTWSHFQDMLFMKEQMNPREVLLMESLVKAEIIEDSEDNVNVYGYDGVYHVPEEATGGATSSEEGRENGRVEDRGRSLSAPEQAQANPDESDREIRFIQKRVNEESEDDREIWRRSKKMKIPAPNDSQLEDDRANHWETSTDDTPSYHMPSNLARDEDYNFLISFLPYLKSMSPRRKLICRIKMCELLYESAYGP